jgi:glutamate racemase
LRGVSDAPVGIFDSGVGGLSVLREIRLLLPAEDLLFVADSAHAPYGVRPAEEIRARSHALTEFLIEQGAKAVVVACNTATAAAADELRASFGTPIVAMEPAVKPAVAATQSGVVGVLATVGTLKSARFAALLDRFGADVTVVTEPGVGLVEQIEAGDLTGDRTRALVEQRVAPMLAAGADVIILGCTHYPFLRELVAEIAGPAVTLVDTGAAVARRLQDVLADCDLTNDAGGRGTERFWTTADAEAAGPVMSVLLGRPVDVQALTAVAHGAS